MFREEIQIQATRARERLQAFPEIATSEAQTKNSLIEPFLRCLGYDPSHPQQVMLEVATELGGKIDYVLTGEANVKIAVEAKKAGINLSQKETNQLRSYFTFSEAAAAILTNGIDYWLFTDLDKTNVMDSEPYRKISIRNLTDNDIHHLEALTRSRVQPSAVREQAQREHYRTRVNEIVDQELNSPSQEFLRLVGKKAGVKPLTKPHLEFLKPLVVEALVRDRRPPPPPPPPAPTVLASLFENPLPTKTYRQILISVVTELQTRHPNDFAIRTSKEPFVKHNRTWQYISKNEKDLSPSHEKRQVGGYFIDVNLSASRAVARSHLFLSAFGHRPKELEVHSPPLGLTNSKGPGCSENPSVPRTTWKCWPRW